MPSFNEHATAVVRGAGIFDNGGASNAVAYLNELADLQSLESKEEKTSRQASGTVTYSLDPVECASPAAAEKVRKHLDSSVLVKLCKKMIANYFNPLSVDDYTCHGYVPVILGACIMSHGCLTPLESLPGYHMFLTTYRQFLCGIFGTAPLTVGAKVQMKKALDGPDPFKPGTGINFRTYGLSATVDPSIKPFLDEKSHKTIGGMPLNYKGKYESDAHAVVSMIGPCSKGDMEYGPADECGGCSRKLKKGLICARCKDQRYCNRECQRKDIRRHKAVCRTPEDVEAMFGTRSIMWMNTYHMVGGGGMGGLGSLMQMFGGMGMGMGN
ncbi:hypothetical protein LTR97_011089 [Elasticomyces elasticus]|uniref:MYND-type domain-containing protein n=1 Tax=Elasticomyces elasticus TaxID=574655 RepID=A0AAN7ZYR3_9PEZI|nr:hypothetical protein LTR97_011089 [Elasticomyces elasticus]